MMFLFHSAMMIALIAIALGISLVVWSLRNDGQSIALAKVFGSLIVIIAILGTLCSIIYSVKYWYGGYFEMPMLQGEAFLFHVAQMLALVAIAVGIILIAWASRNQGIGVSLTKFFGGLIVVVAILGLLCVSYYGIVYWSKGYLETPVPTMQSKSMDEMGNMQNIHKGMMQGQ
ncbi:MAG: hypothetical protein ACYCQI_07220 [Gammaproteobacteria bacterium]